MSEQLKENQTSEAVLIVKPSDLASALPLTEQDAFPEVFATSRMIALMELAAARMMQSLLQEGELSVGVGVNILHTAATTVDEEVRALATFVKQEGKLYHFNVEVFDKGGSVGKGEHTRAIVSAERLIGSAKKRLNKEL
ncbi:MULTISPECIES: thioesterase family protein [Empedobacter]|uniref:thioesterase family protein n=1 Tax=Empedobacter TaxID=59734 RepID=UPI001C5838F8|nr:MULTISPECIES: hotdog domain-containing protein [Empedobacter]MBW1619057.1 thioesterase [Empedobacter falsenii]MDM1040187.1 thioesterase [Empedobacter brevis]MDM1134119.1 thioesterase [Empedobacter sp. R750]